MVSAVNDPVNEAWDKVSSWPASWRLSLATQLLNSLNGSTLIAAPSGTPGDLVGAWKVPQPPADTEVERILDEERQRKFGDTPVAQRGETLALSPWSDAPLGLTNVRRSVTQGCALGYRVSPRWGKAAKQNRPVFGRHQIPPRPTLAHPSVSLWVLRHRSGGIRRSARRSLT